MRLYFSKPVKIEIPLSVEHDQSTIQAKVQHSWDADFWVSWLTNDPNAVCNNWVANPSSDIATMSWTRLAIIYSCSASNYWIFYQVSFVEVKLQISGADYNVFFPISISFPSIQVENITWTVVIDTASLTSALVVTWSNLTWAYFWIQDLTWSNSWFSLNLQSNDLIANGSNSKIWKELIIISISWATWYNMTWTWQGWLFLLNWDNPPEVKTYTWTSQDFSAWYTIMYRNEKTTPAEWRVWMYWIQPIFQIQVRKYQTLGEYTSTFVLTLTPN